MATRKHWLRARRYVVCSLQDESSEHGLPTVLRRRREAIMSKNISVESKKTEVIFIWLFNLFAAIATMEGRPSASVFAIREGHD